MFVGKPWQFVRCLNTLWLNATWKLWTLAADTRTFPQKRSKCRQRQIFPKYPCLQCLLRSQQHTAVLMVCKSDWYYSAIPNWNACMYVLMSWNEKSFVGKRHLSRWAKQPDPWCHASISGRRCCRLDGYFISYCVFSWVINSVVA